MIYKLTLIIIIAVILGTFVFSLTSRPPSNLGMKDGRLAACPGSPNCVSSQAADSEHAIAAISVTGSSDDVLRKLEKTVLDMGGEISAKDGPYLHAVFKSRVFRFPDDLECYYNAAAGQIEVRSAARLGYSDFSVNRKRVEHLRELMQQN
ncbi:DUF1499 domain-containing protein [Maridesulfovibrio sp. FT414]|uniref:DUF1499 domain-containing protein n=1 Tax=Maridesulfovibrio sp. FT414 TaxID=2979469 RepID=UPI003D802D27